MKSVKMCVLDAVCDCVGGECMAEARTLLFLNFYLQFALHYVQIHCAEERQIEFEIPGSPDCDQIQFR